MEEVVRTRRVQTDIFYNGVDANIYISDTLSDFQYDDSTAVSYTHLDVYKRQVQERALLPCLAQGTAMSWRIFR